MRQKTVLSLALLALFLVVSGGFYRYYYSTDKQLYLLQQGSLKQKIVAAHLLGERDVGDAVPFLVDHLDVSDGGAYVTKSPESLSCIASVALNDITNVDIGNTCCYHSKCKQESENNKEKWIEWYKNEYPSWVKQYEQ